MLTGRFAAVATLLVLGGCTVGPDYHPPATALPAAYAGAQEGEQPAADLGQWWQAFNDPLLNDLIARARSGNLDLAQAAARVEAARALERATRARGGPSLNADAQAGYTQLSKNSFPPALANLGGGQPGGAGGLGLAGEDFATFQAGFDASWELDLFGGQKRAEQAAGARAEAAEWSQRDAQVMLAAEVARTFQQFRLLQRRIALAGQMLATGREILDLVQARTANGLATSVDQRQQERAIDLLETQRGDLQAEAEVRVHALSTLLGLAPAALNEQLAAAPAGEPAAIDVPPGLPSELLQRRPDIRAAERQVAAATADIGVATADLYPRIGLTGALQLASRALSNLLASDSIFANGGGKLSLPLLGGGRREMVDVRQAQARQALLAYQGTVLSALRDVEDSLTRLAADRQRAAGLRAAAGAASDIEDTARVRFRHGLTPEIEALQARQSWLADSDSLAQAEAAAAQDTVALYKALGGGWDEHGMTKDEEQASDRGS